MNFTYCAVFCIALAAASADYCFTSDDNPYRLYTSKTAYDNARNKDAPENETPEGCEAVHMYFVARHGSRYSIFAKQRDLAEKLLPYRDSLLESNNLLCNEDLEALRNWEPILEENNDGTQAQRGWDEFRTIAQRFKTRVPEIFERPYNESLYTFQHTNWTGRGDRSKDSALAFVEGLWGSYDDIILEESTNPDWLLYFYTMCDKFKKTVKELPNTEYDAFTQGPYMRQVLRRMETRLGLGNMSLDYEVANRMYESCRTEYLVRDDVSPWCVAFTPEDLLVFEYSSDLYFYWRNSYPHNISSAQACPLIADIVNNFQEAIGGTGKLFAGGFGHTTMIQTFFTLLGLHHDSVPLTASNYDNMADRKWRVSLNGAMGSNGAFILYKCDSLPTYRVKTFINERPTILPQCKDYSCDLDDVMSTWKPIADNCDIEDKCKWPEGDEIRNLGLSRTNSDSGIVAIFAFVLSLFLKS